VGLAAHRSVAAVVVVAAFELVAEEYRNDAADPGVSGIGELEKNH